MSAYTSLRDVACDKSLGIAKYLLKVYYVSVIDRSNFLI